jgi:uncharacterized protein (UPF0210 family)
MELRSITLFCEPDFSHEDAASFFAAAVDAFAVPVQTRRVALPPFPNWWQPQQPAEAQAEAIARQWQEATADYVSLGPVQLRHHADWLGLLPEVLGAGDVIFASAEVADQHGHIDTGRCTAVARVIRQASTLQENGFGNLYFTALANCPAGSPFFPVAYHGGGAPGFALAVQAADLAQQAMGSAGDLTEARRNLVSAIEREAAALTQASEALAHDHPLAFRGIDFSLAPFPDDDTSLARAMEALGLPWVGAAGSLFAAAFIAEAIDRATFRRCGFSGLMLPVLEDSVLALRAGAGHITVNDLLSYAAVCGVGLDTIPLPGDVDVASLGAILCDVAALATRLDKPLTARLMPLPGLKAGDPVHFDFPYFADSGVMAVTGGSGGLLQKAARLALRPHSA